MSGQGKTPGRIRIVGGRWRGRKIQVRDVEQLRPTPDRVRETVFNWLRNHIEGATCLDLFAGTGILGIEAVSRGAAVAVLVEHDRELVISMRMQVETLGSHALEIVHADALEWLSRCEQVFDIVFLDPPFRSGLVAKSCSTLLERELLGPGGLVYVESEPGLNVDVERFEIVKQSSAGQVQYMLLAKKRE